MNRSENKCSGAIHHTRAFSVTFYASNMYFLALSMRDIVQEKMARRKGKVKSGGWDKSDLLD